MGAIRAERGAEGALPASRVEANEKEVRDVRGGDEEHQRDGAEQCPQRPRQHVADDGIAQRLHGRAKAGALVPIPAIHLGEDFRQTIRERREIALGVRRGNARLEPADRAPGVIVPHRRRIHPRRRPYVHFQVGQIRAARQHADDGHGKSLDVDHLTYHVRRRAEAARPVPVAEDDDGG
jgi:hypothetical protein